MEASESDSEQASTCQGSDSETDPLPKPKQTNVSGKAGAAVYRTKFNRGWSKTYPFIVGVKADPFKFLCTICQRQIACEHQGKRDVERHIGKSMHQENAKSMKAQTTLKIHSESSALAEKVSLVVQLL